jgi:hypothetical protein
MISRRLVTAVGTATLMLLAPMAAAQGLPPGGSFTDDDGSVHEGNIEAIAAIGVTKGCNPPGNTRFCPDSPVTRGEMAAFLVRAFPALTDDGGGNSFTDDDGNVFEAEIARIAAAGITRGCNPPGNTRYCPDSPVTRGEMAAFLVRALDLDDDGGGNSFTDDDGNVFEADIARLAAAGITRGCNPPDNTRYCPGSPVTRAEMATFLTRGLGLTPIVPDPRPVSVVPVPPAAAAEDTSDPDVVIGNGTPAGCTSAAVVAAVKAGGVITFDCGPDPVTIEMQETAVVHNWADGNTGTETRMVVLDGGGLVTLSGGGAHQIISMNTCDPDLGWTTSHCNDQQWPYLVVQNLTFVDGDATGVKDLEGDAFGGGAIGVRGGRLKVVDSGFYSNTCDETGPDVGGGAVRAIGMWTGAPVYITGSVFGDGPATGNVCSNGGAVSGLHASITVLNSRFAHNETTGWGANPAQSGTPGGGNGGALYADGTNMDMYIGGTLIEDNRAAEGGGAVFFVSNNRAGHLIIEESTLRDSPSGGFWTAPYTSIFYLGDGPIQVTDSTIE